MTQNHYEQVFKNITGIDFDKFYTTHKSKLNWHLTKYNLDKDTAEDYVDEAFMQCLHKIDTYNPEKNAQPHTWLYKIAENIVILAWRNSKKMNLLSLDKELNSEDTNKTFCDLIPYENDDEDVERINTQNVKKSMIFDTIKKLPPIYQDILHLREIDNLQYKEISESILQDYEFNESGNIRYVKEPTGFKEIKFKNFGRNSAFVRYYILSENKYELIREDIVESGWEYYYEEIFYKYNKIEIDCIDTCISGSYTSFMNLSTVKSRIFHARDKVFNKLKRKFDYIDIHGVDFIPLKSEQ